MCNYIIYVIYIYIYTYIINMMNIMSMSIYLHFTSRKR